MAGGEKFIQQEVGRLEREVTPKQYCFLGKMIKLAYGPASDKFSQHVNGCGQCSQALDWERAAPRQ